MHEKGRRVVGQVDMKIHIVPLGKGPSFFERAESARFAQKHEVELQFKMTPVQLAHPG
jgi:hypothetical protein